MLPSAVVNASASASERTISGRRGYLTVNTGIFFFGGAGSSALRLVRPGGEADLGAGGRSGGELGVAVAVHLARGDAAHGVLERLVRGLRREVGPEQAGLPAAQAGLVGDLEVEERSHPGLAVGDAAARRSAASPGRRRGRRSSRRSCAPPVGGSVLPVGLDPVVERSPSPGRPWSGSPAPCTRCSRCAGRAGAGRCRRTPPSAPPSACRSRPRRSSRPRGASTAAPRWSSGTGCGRPCRRSARRGRWRGRPRRSCGRTRPASGTTLADSAGLSLPRGEEAAITLTFGRGRDEGRPSSGRGAPRTARAPTLWPSASNWGRQKRPVFGSFQITTSTTPG